MTIKDFLKYFNLLGTGIKTIEILQDFDTILLFEPNSLRHGKMNCFLERCLLSSFSIEENKLMIYIK